MWRRAGARVPWLCAILWLASPARAGWQWLHYELGDDNALLDVSLADERAGCAVGVIASGGSSAPLVLCTEDGGQSLRRGELGSGMIVPQAVAMADASVGFLTTFEFTGWPPGSKLYRSADGGRTWEAQTLPAGAEGGLADVFCVDRDTCWAAGAGGVFRTTDGAAWEAGALPALAEGLQVEGLFFLDALHGFAVGGQPGVEPQNEWEEPIPPCCGFVLESTDGGLHWRVLADGLAGGLRRVSFPDAQHGWAAGGGASGLILATLDGGATWTPQALPNGALTYVSDVTFPEPGAGYAVANVGEGTPTVLTCQDGQTWQADGTYADAFDGLAFPDSMVAWAPLFSASFPVKGMGMVTGKYALLVSFQGQGYCPDADADGHASDACGGDDCDDQNPYLHPGAEELCNRLDDDCDGIADDGIDFQRDPLNCGECGFNCMPAQVCWEAECTVDCPAELTRCGQFCADTLVDLAHCGGCDRPCEPPHAAAACVDGGCQMGACEAGWVDLDPGQPGCEYACSPAGPEECNHLDDDCDGEVDEDLEGCEAQPDGGQPDGGQPDGGGGADGAGAPDSSGCGQGPGGSLAGLAGLAAALLLLGRRRAR